MLNTRLPEIQKFFRQHMTSIQARQRAGEDIASELEAKFGYYTPKGFRSDVPFSHYDRLLEDLRERVGNEVVEQSTVAQAQGIRRITTVGLQDAPDTVLWQQKTKNQDFEFAEYDIRISVSTERNLSHAEIPRNFKPDVTRDRTRHTFVKPEVFSRIDLTEVMMRSEDGVAKESFEVEVEFTGTADDLHVFVNHLSSMFKLLRGTSLIFTNTAKRSLIRDITELLGGEIPNNIDKNILVQARNIKHRDLVDGGIVGNRSTNYVVTFKADGLRKMFIIHKTGVWLVYPPFEYNLVLDTSLNIPNLDVLLNKLSGTVLDGELVEPKEYSAIPYWYIGFDCLAFPGEKIQAKPYAERKRRVEAIFRPLQTNIMYVAVKDSKEITTPEEFFAFTSEFLNKRDTLPYPEDGLIFIPAQTEYNPHSERFDLKDRVLTRQPDVCKWKQTHDITIDFALKWVDKQQLELYSYDDKARKMVKFEGSTINPLTADMIDHTNAVTLGKPTNLIVEYEWSPALNKLRPRRIRYDKRGPNTLAIALDDWSDIMDPVTEGDMRGTTLELAYRYHSRIKKDLYHTLARGTNLLDIGSGMGGDVAKWLSLRPGRVVAVEPSKFNRDRLEQRIQTFDMTEYVRVVPTGGEDTHAITQAVQDFIPGAKVDVVSLMLSMSFFWASSVHLDAMVRTIVNNLRPGGKIIFLTIDGDTLEQIFEPALGGPVITDLNIGPLSMHIHPRQRAPYGRPLDFLLPGTIVGAQREYLVHVHEFTQRLAAHGFQLTQVLRAEGERMLSAPAKLYASMYSFGYYDNVQPELLTPTDVPNAVLPAQPVVEVQPVAEPIEPVVEVEPIVEVQPVAEPIEPVLPVLPTLPTLPTLHVVQPTKIAIAQTQLPWLQVRHTTARGAVVKGVAANDDTYAPLTCTWYANLVRIATIGDGSCFIHAVLKAFYQKYQENDSARYRLNLAAEIRRDLAVALNTEDPRYPGHVYWLTSARGAFPRMVMQEIQDEDLVRDLQVDYSMAGLQHLFNSSSQLGDEVYTFISDVLNIDIYVLRATATDLHPHYHTHRVGIHRDAIVIIGNMYHYEVLAVQQPGGFQTVFPEGDAFLTALTNVFIGDGGFEDIRNAMPYDPDETFVNDAVSVFGLEIPEIINEIFPHTDAFRMTLERLRPAILEHAQVLRGIPQENANTQQLEAIEAVLRDNGYDPESIHNIRDIITHRLAILGVDVNRDIASVISEAVVDGLIAPADAELMLRA